MGGFLRCANCCRWGQPWKLKTFVLCEERRDEDGDFYTASHMACKYFVPLQGSVPVEFAKLRLLVQSLDGAKREALRWALLQADVLLELVDANGNVLALGDYVKFVLDTEYVGIVEGADPHTNVVHVFCPAFPDANISLEQSSLEKLSPEEARTSSLGVLTTFEEGTVGWHMECILEEINKLRSLPKDELIPEKYRLLLEYQQRWNEMDSRLRYSVVARSLSH
jgi:hypothetical protein